jgi:hypothetical protein
MNGMARGRGLFHGERKAFSGVAATPIFRRCRRKN